MTETDYFEIGAGFSLSTLSFVIYGLLALIGLAWASWVTYSALNSYMEASSQRDDNYFGPVLKGWITYIAITLFYGAIIF